MSVSNEWFEWHLTPNGWIEGSKKIDGSGVYQKEIPNESVLTLCFHERLSSPFSRAEQYYTIAWQHSDKALIEKLVQLHGDKPHQYNNGYFLR